MKVQIGLRLFSTTCPLEEYTHYYKNEFHAILKNDLHY